VDVIDVLKNFYGDASKVQELSARLLGVPIGGFPGIPQVPKLPDFLPDLPVIPDLPSIPSPGDIIGSIRLPWGMAADMLSEGAGPGDTTGLASKGLVPVVLVTMPTMSDDNGGAEPKMVPLLAAVPAQQADDALTWTQAQVNEYVREQRIGFVKSTLQFFTPEEVFESSKSMFADLSADEVRIYIAEAGGELKGVED
jgi:hypothetical protein